MPFDLPRLIRDLLHQERYPHRPPEVHLVQTHISYVLIARPYVYKIKKPVYFGFLDYRTPEKRRHFCLEEVRLNRRTSRNVYLGVVDISEIGGEHFAEDSRNPVEAAVKMRYLPDEQMLFSMVEKNRVDDLLMVRIGRAIADFHRHADTSPEISRYGSTSTVLHHAMENFHQLEPFRGTTLSRDRHAELRSWTGNKMDMLTSLIEERVRKGKIRDGHGDLRPKHIYVAGDFIHIIDCIEFNPAYRYQDVASDLAFLCMEIEYQNRPDLANIVFNEYLAQTGDFQMVRLWDFYRVYRAMVRGKVASLTFAEQEMGEGGRAAALAQARRFFDLAFSYITRIPQPALTITCGLSGSGKSFQARRLASRSGAVIIRSDTVRKSLAGLEPRSSARSAYGTGIYSPERSEQTYDALASLAEIILTAGFPVILDATYSRKRRRDVVRALAGRLDIPFGIIRCTAPRNVLLERLRGRRDPEEPSDSGPELLDAQEREFEPLTPLETSFVLD